MQMGPVWECSPGVGMQCETAGCSSGQNGNSAVDLFANRFVSLMGSDTLKLCESIERHCV